MPEGSRRILTRTVDGMSFTSRNITDVPKSNKLIYDVQLLPIVAYRTNDKDGRAADSSNACDSYVCRFVRTTIHFALSSRLAIGPSTLDVCIDGIV